MGSSPDFPILGPPRITLAGFAAVLRAGGSPAAGEAAGEYAAFIAAGVDPAVGLAIFRKESSFGRAGIARGNLSWGNIRSPTGAFIHYPSWTAGAKDAARLLTVYGHNAIRRGVTTSTVQTFPYVWAPAADHNAPDKYGDDLASWIAGWQRQYLPNGPGSYTPPPFTGQLVSSAVDVRTFAAWQAALQRLGIPSAADHVLTADEVGTIMRQVYGIDVDPGGFVDARVGLTVRQAWDKGATPGLPDAAAAAAAAIPDAIAALPAAIGEALVTVAELAAILALIVVGLYLVVRSPGAAS